ncbi:MAG: histidine phosphatase family protein [Cyclobacteriaceae bacterium]
MMKRSLYLLRHSYAEPPGDGNDFGRGLTMEGLTTVRALGRKLGENDFNPDLIVSSNAIRAEDTAINLTEELGISEQVITYDEKIYEASVRELLEILNEFDGSVKSALLIGHNPTISFFGEYLTGNGFAGMEPCGLVTITFDVAWEEISQGSGKFVSYFHPNH